MTKIYMVNIYVKKKPLLSRGFFFFEWGNTQKTGNDFLSIFFSRRGTGRLKNHIS